MLIAKVMILALLVSLTSQASTEAGAALAPPPIPEENGDAQIVWPPKPFRKKLNIVLPSIDEKQPLKDVVPKANAPIKPPQPPTFDPAMASYIQLALGGTEVPLPASLSTAQKSALLAKHRFNVGSWWPKWLTFGSKGPKANVGQIPDETDVHTTRGPELSSSNEEDHVPRSPADFDRKRMIYVRKPIQAPGYLESGESSVGTKEGSQAALAETGGQAAAKEPSDALAVQNSLDGKLEDVPTSVKTPERALPIMPHWVSDERTSALAKNKATLRTLMNLDVNRAVRAGDTSSKGSTGWYQKMAQLRATAGNAKQAALQWFRYPKWRANPLSETAVQQATSPSPGWGQRMQGGLNTAWQRAKSIELKQRLQDGLNTAWQRAKNIELKQRLQGGFNTAWQRASNIGGPRTWFQTSPSAIPAGAATRQNAGWGGRMLNNARQRLASTSIDWVAKARG